MKFSARAPGLIMVALLILTPSLPIPALITHDLAPSKETGARETLPVYINKLSPAPNVDGSWGSGEWSRASALDVSVGGGQCMMYIGFDTGGHRLFIGLDVPSDTSADTLQSEAELALICIDGDNDGVITYTNPTGLPEDVVLPLTYGGPCRDRWAQIFGWNTNYAGWINIDGPSGYPVMWRDAYGYEHTDQMRAGFSGHRFYEYSIDYQRSLGLTPGKDTLFGVNILIRDGNGDANPDTQTRRGALPWNYSGIAGPWALFALAQAPLARIKAPAEGEKFFLDEEIEFDASDTTYDSAKAVTFTWDFGDGARETGKVVHHTYSRVGRYTVTLEVVDSEGLSNLTRVTIEVRERNFAPEILSYYPTNDPVIHEGENLVFSVNVTDENLDVGDELRVNWSVNGSVRKSSLLKGPGSHRSELPLLTSYDGELSAGRYKVEVSIQDSYLGGCELPVLHSWNLTVENTNRPPVIVVALPDTEELEVQEGAEAYFSIEKLDPDGDRMTVLWFVDDMVMGAFRDRDQFIYQPDHNSSGLHRVKVAVTDRELGRAERNWSVNVINVNRPPEINIWSPRDDAVEVYEGKEISFSISPFDPDMDPLSVQWLIDDEPVRGQGSTSFSFAAAYEGEGSAEGSPYTVKAVVRDPGGLAASHTWELTVRDANRPPIPVISEPENGSRFRLGSIVRFRAGESWDPDSNDNNILSFSWDFADGKTASGPEVSHRFTRPGLYQVTLRLRDRLVSSYASVNITITAPVLWVKDIRFEPLARAYKGAQVNITLQIYNTGDAPATGVRVKLLMDGAPLAGLEVARVDPGETAEVLYVWIAEGGNHTFRAVIDPREDIVVPDGSPSERTIFVKARPAPEARAFPAALAGALAGLAAVVVLAVVWAVTRRRRVAAGRAAGEEGPAVEAGAPALIEAETPPSGPPEGLTTAPEAPSTAPAPVPTASPPAPAPAEAPPEPHPPAKEEARCPSCGGASPAAGILCEECVERETAELEKVEAGVRAEAAAIGALSAPKTGQVKGPAPVMKCATCGEPLEEGWRACPTCGTGVGIHIPIREVPTCPTCGEPLEDDWLACPNCGTAIK
ncbi:MAG: PKD domain-containing protein [Thermoplasmata archaeon]